MARERTPYFKRYPKIVRAKRIVLPIAIGVMLSAGLQRTHANR